MSEEGQQPDGPSKGTLFPDRDAAAEAPVVMAVRELAGTPKRVSVIVGRRRVATLLVAQAMEAGLAPGTLWTVELAARVARMERVNAAKSLAMRRLAARARSRTEVRAWLLTKGIDAEVAQEAVERLAEVGLINDGQVEEDERRAATARGLSGRALEARLRSRGVEVGDVTLVGAGGEHGRAAEVARAELSRRPAGSADVTVLARRLMGVLARKGYEEDVARQAVAGVLRERGMTIDIVD